MAVQSCDEMILVVVFALQVPKVSQAQKQTDSENWLTVHVDVVYFTVQLVCRFVRHVLAIVTRKCFTN